MRVYGIAIALIDFFMLYLLRIINIHAFICYPGAIGALLITNIFSATEIASCTY